MVTLAGIGSILGGLSGLFGGGMSKRGVDQGHAIRKVAWGARAAADEYGFNPLTLLQQGNAAPIAGQGPAPLASVQMLTDGLRSIDDEMSGDAARRRAADQLEIDIAKLKLDQARSGVKLAAAANAADAIGGGPAPFGRRTATHGAINARIASPKMSAPKSTGKPVGKQQNPYAPDRVIERDKIVNSPGVFEIENMATGGKPITIPGEGEPWGIDELGTAVVVGLPQVVDNYLGEKVHKWFGGFDGPRTSREYWADPKGWAEKRAKQAKEKADKKELEMQDAAKKINAGSFSKPLPFKR